MPLTRRRALVATLALLLIASPLSPLAGAQTGGGGGGGTIEISTEDYNVTEIATSPVNLTSQATALDMTDDEVTAAFPLGFSIPFFGTSTDLFWVGSNGFVTMHFQTGPGCCEGQPLPTAGDPDGIIAGFWTDLDPSSGGQIAFEGTELGGQNAMVVDYDQIPVAGTQTTASFQVHILSNGTFEIHLLDAPSPSDRNTTVGAENIDGTRGIQLFRQIGGDLSDRAFRFVPNATSEPVTGNDLYNVESIPGELVTPTTAAERVALGDDDITGALPLGFEIRFFETTTDLFWISSNGFVTMHFQTSPGCCEGQPIPTAGDPDGVIAGFWTDLDPSSGGAILFEQTTVNGTQALVVTYQEVPVVSTNETVTFQVVIRADSVIELRFASASDTSGRSVSVGLENIDGTLGVELANLPDFSATDVGVAFVPTSGVDAPAPRLEAVDPTQGLSGDTVLVSGSGFQDGARVSFGSTEASTTFLDQDRLEATVPSGLSPGVVDVSVENPDGRSDTLPDAFEILPGLVVDAVVPATARQADTVTVTGGPFEPGTLVALDDVLLEPGTVANDQIQLTLPADLPVSLYDVTARLPSGESATLADGLAVLGRPDLAVTSITAERDGLSTELFPGHVPVPGPWDIEVEVHNAGDAAVSGAEIEVIAWADDGPAQSFEEPAYHVATFEVDELATGETLTLSTTWGDAGRLGDHSFLAQGRIVAGLGDRDTTNDQASTSGSAWVGGLGGTTLAEERRHERVHEDRLDLHENATVRLDAVMEEEQFTFGNFPVVFTTFSEAADGTESICTTWRFFGGPDGFFTVTMTEDNGWSGLVEVPEAEARSASGEELTERWRETVAGGVILTESQPSQEVDTLTDPLTRYAFAKDPAATWRVEAVGLTGDFTHCQVREPDDSLHQTFTYAALPSDTDRQVPSFSGMGQVQDLEMTYEETSARTTSHPVVQSLT